jgi:phosphoglycolate phosphatase
MAKTKGKTSLNPEGVIFDLDGTLLDTLEDLASAVNRVLARKGFPTHDLDTFRFFVGEGVVVLITRSLPEDKRDNETIRMCLEAFRDDYGRNWNVKTKPYDGAAEMLDALTDRGLKMAILSNKPDDFTKCCVSELLSNWSFGVVFGQRDGIPPKPDPAAALEVAELLEIAPADFVYLGDSAVDMKTAAAANMFPVGALWGFRPAQELQDGGARVLIGHPMEILGLLG